MKIFFLFLASVIIAQANPNKIQYIKDLFGHGLNEKATDAAISLYHQSNDDNQKAECLFLLHKIAKERKLEDIARSERERLVETYPNSTFAKQLISEKEESVKNAILEALKDEDSLKQNWNFFGLKSGMTKEEAAEVSYPDFLTGGMDSVSVSNSYDDDLIYKSTITIKIYPGKLSSDDYSNKTTAVFVILGAMYPEADCSMKVNSSTYSYWMEIKMEFTNEKIAQKKQNAWLNTVAEALAPEKQI